MRREHVVGDAALPRWTHPGAWWVWALCLATAASRTTNPLLLGLIVAVAGLVVARRRSEAPWARSFSVFLRLGAVIIVLHILFTVLVGSGFGTRVLFTLPSVPLPSWFAGVTLGGPVTLEEVLAAAYQGLLLATMLACIGAANSLASPARLLASVPAALYEVGVAVVVAMTFAPQLVGDVARVRTARRLRGRPDRGVRALAGSVMPVLEGSLERAVDLAAAMDSRGYGRTGPLSARARTTSRALLLLGLVGVVLGLYGLLDGGTPGAAGPVVLVLGLAAGATGMVLASRRSIRTRYRPDPWALPEWLVVLAGAVPAVVLVAVSITDPPALVGPVAPPAWPALPLGPALAVLVGAAAGFAAPPPPGTSAVRTLRPGGTHADDREEVAA
ncbi:MAG TPA: energy-coupling factor transporter transmembrane component T [Candidatus Nanopelagicales bacterium]|nr:energy-coupling factor transporter transmembrane component T [Candidatus Nanopelagicales bacterium]